MTYDRTATSAASAVPASEPAAATEPTAPQPTAPAASFSQRVYAVVRGIPRGKVATYGQVAALAGNPRNARFVGFALHANPDPEHIPCHRVVFRDGSLAPGFAFGGPDEQRRRLEREGVRFIAPGDVPDHDSAVHRSPDHVWRVDLTRCQWQA